MARLGKKTTPETKPGTVVKINDACGSDRALQPGDTGIRSILVTSRVFAFLVFVPLIIHTARAAVSISEVGIDGQRKRVNASSTLGEAPREIRFSSSSKDVIFHFSGDSLGGVAPVRLRFRLDGFDMGWRDLPEQMHLWLRLYGKGNKLVGGTDVPLKGETPGWNGQSESAPLVKRQVRMTVPDPARALEVFLISNGSPKTTGVMVVDGVQVRIDSPGRSSQVLTLGLQAGDRMDYPLGFPAGWRREGSKPEIARIGWRTQPDRHPVLLLEDGEREFFGVWVSRLTSMPMERGDEITLEWQTAFSIGCGGNGMASYSGLLPGHYQFRVQAANVNGLPTGDEVSLSVIVTPPLYRRTEFWLGLLLAGIGAGVFARRYVIRRRILARLAKMEREHLLEMERARIARDIHDDFGSNLTKIAYLGDTLLGRPGLSPEAVSDVDKIRLTARELTRSLDETVWAIDPEKDTMECLVGYLSGVAQELLSAAGVNCLLDFPDTLPSNLVSCELRHHIFLAFKEAICNILRHARATDVNISLAIESPNCTLTVADNGCGFDLEGRERRRSGGHGLNNIRARFAAIGGHFEVRSRPGGGTELRLTWRIEA